MKPIVLVATIGLLITCFGLEIEQMSIPELPHSFMTHMGLPENPGEIDLRIYGYHQLHDSLSIGDVGFHLETGILNRMGLHVRTDGIKNEKYAELVVQYAPVLNRQRTAGLSIVGQLNVLINPPGDRYQGLVGMSGSFPLGNRIMVDLFTHANPKDRSLDIEGSLVASATDRFSVSLESEVELSSDGQTFNILPGAKIRLAHHNFLGIGLELPVGKHHEFDSRTVISFDVGF